LRSTLRRSALFILATGVVAGVAAAVTTTALPPRFVAVQQLDVESSPLGAGSSADVSQSRLLSTDAALLSSDAVLGRAGSAVGVNVQTLRDQLTVSVDTNS